MMNVHRISSAVLAVLVGALVAGCSTDPSAQRNPSKYTVTVSTLSPIAGTAVTATAVLSDASGKPVATAGRTVTWTSTPSQFGGAPVTSTTDETGTATVQYLSSTTAGSFVITATDSAGLTGASPSIVSVAAVVSAAKSTLTAMPAAILPADGKSKFTLTLQAKDAFGNNIPVSVGTGVISASPGSIGTVSATTDNHDGTYTASVTSTFWGIAFLDFTLGGVTHTVANTVMFSRLTPTQYIITSNVQSPVAGSSVTLSAQEADSAGNAVTAPNGQALTWSVTGAAGTFSNFSPGLSGNGIGTVTYTTSATAGLATINVIDNFGIRGSTTITSVAGSQRRAP